MPTYECFSPTLRESAKYGWPIDAMNTRTAATSYYDKVHSEGWDNIPEAFMVVVMHVESAPVAYRVSKDKEGKSHAEHKPMSMKWLC